MFATLSRGQYYSFLGAPCRQLGTQQVLSQLAELKVFVVLAWMYMSLPCSPLPNPYAEALTLSVVVIWSKGFWKVIRSSRGEEGGDLVTGLVPFIRRGRNQNGSLPLSLSLCLPLSHLLSPAPPPLFPCAEAVRRCPL